MATQEKANLYEGGTAGLGTGGKFRKRLFRRSQTTPYDRPPTSLRNPARNNNNKNGWLSKVVDPAHRLITYSAHSLFSSLFRKRLPPSQSRPSSSETEQEVRDSHQEEVSFVSNNSSGKQQAAVGGSNVQINCSDGGGLTELEKLLRQKTFTRSEIDHLTTLMRSRTVDAPIREEEKQTEVVPSEPVLSCEQKEDYPKTPVLENGIENRLVLTPYVPIEDAASPAKLAKAYMGSRPSKVYSSMLGVQNLPLREDPTFLKSENLPLKSPIMSIVPRTVRYAGVHENGFVTPRTRGRSAIYNMARTPYARIYPTPTLKGGGLVEGEPSYSTQCSLDQDMHSRSKQGAVKRRSSALDNDIGSVGPIRRIRHKSNLLYSKGSSLPLSGSSLSIARSGVSVDASQESSSSIQKSILLDKVKHSHKLSEENVGDTRPSMSLPPLPSKSSELASKILQQLDQLVSPKDKSSELRLPTMNDKSPMKLSLSMLHGQALQSMEAVDSSKLLDTIKDNKLDVDLGNLSASTQKLTSQVDKVENGPLKLLAPSDGLVPVVTDADSTKPRNQVIYSAKSGDSFMIKSVSYPPQKKRAFHMSVHEDCLDLDDDAYPNGAVPSVFSVEKEMTSSTAMAEKTTSGTEAIAEEVTLPLSVVMPSKSSTIGGEAHVGTAESADGSRVGEKVNVSTSITSSITNPTFKPVTVSVTAATETSVGSNKPASPNGSIANPPMFNFGNKLVSSVELTATGALSKEITNSGPIFGLEKVVSSKEPGSDAPLVNNRNVDKVPQMLFTSSSAGGESTFLKFGASSDSKLGSSTSSTTAAGAADFMPKVREFGGNADTKSNIDSGRSSELAFSSAASTSPTSIFTFGHSNGSHAASTSFSSPFTSLASNNFTSQNVFCSSSLAASSSISATSTPAIIASSNSSSSNPSVASSSSPTSFFNFGSSPVPSKGLPVSSSGSEPLETKSRQDAGNGNLSSTAFGSSSAAVGSTGSGFYGFSSPAMTTVNSHSQGSVIGASNGSVLDAHASPATSGFATSTQTQSVSFGSSAPSPLFGLTRNTAFSSGSSLFPSSNSATNIFNSGTTFGLSTSASSSAANSVSSNSGTNSALFGPSSWQPSNSPFGSAFSFSSSSSGFSFGTSTTSVASTSSPTMFSSTTSSSTPQFSFTSAAATASTLPAFGNTNSVFTFGSAPVNNDQMSMEDSMAEDTVQATPPATPIFGQQPAPVQSNFVFGASTPSGASPFQFGSQQNIAPQNSSPFQASGSLEFSAGGSFSLGTGGGDKSGRKIVKVKHRLRKK